MLAALAGRIRDVCELDGLFSLQNCKANASDSFIPSLQGWFDIPRQIPVNVCLAVISMRPAYKQLDLGVDAQPPRLVRAPCWHGMTVKSLIQRFVSPATLWPGKSGTLPPNEAASAYWILKAFSSPTADPSLRGLHLYRRSRATLSDEALLVTLCTTRKHQLL